MSLMRPADADIPVRVHDSRGRRCAASPPRRWPRPWPSGMVIVAPHHVVAAAAYLALRQLRGTSSLVSGSRMVTSIPGMLRPTVLTRRSTVSSVRVWVMHRRAFGQAVTDGDFAPCTCCSMTAAHERLRAHGARHDRPCGAWRSRNAGRARWCSTAWNMARHAVQGGAAFSCTTAVHHRHGGEGVEEHHGGPVVHAGHDAPSDAADAVEQAARAGIPGQAIRSGSGGGRSQRALLTMPTCVEHHALGEAGRPGRVLHVHRRHRVLRPPCGKGSPTQGRPFPALPVRAGNTPLPPGLLRATRNPAQSRRVG